MHHVAVLMCASTSSLPSHRQRMHSLDRLTFLHIGWVSPRRKLCCCTPRQSIFRLLFHVPWRRVAVKAAWPWAWVFSGEHWTEQLVDMTSCVWQCEALRAFLAVSMQHREQTALLSHHRRRLLAVHPHIHVLHQRRRLCTFCRHAAVQCECCGCPCVACEEISLLPPRKSC